MKYVYPKHPHKGAKSDCTQIDSSSYISAKGRIVSPNIRVAVPHVVTEPVSDWWFMGVKDKDPNLTYPRVELLGKE